MVRKPAFCIAVLVLALLPGLAAIAVPSSNGNLPGPTTYGQLPYLTAVENKPVTAGVNYRRLEGANALGQPLVGHVLEIDMRDPTLELRPVLAGDRLGGTETVSSLAARYGAIGAVNGSFFARGNNLTLPVGNVVIDGRLLAASDFWRTSFGLTGDGQFLYGFFNPKPTLKVSPSGPTLAVQNLNRPYRAGQLNLYNAAWGETTGTPQGTVEIVLLPRRRGYEVAAVGSGNSPIPPRGLVLAAEPGLLPELAPGTAVELDQGFGPGWQEVRHLLTGGPLLVEGGRPVFQAVQEGFTGTVLARRARTAVARQADGKLLLVVVEGSEAEDKGVTLEEMAVLLSSLGVDTAVGLDGGGSSALWVAGRLVSRPSAGQERPVANALLVLRQIPVYLDGWRLPCDVPPLLSNGRVLVPLRAIFQGLGATVDWDGETGQVRARRNGHEVRLRVGDKTALVDGRPVVLDVPAQVVAGRTLVPIRFVSQALGASVEWRAGERAVYVYR